MIHAYAAGKIERLAPKTVNHSLALLREVLEAAVDWGEAPVEPGSQAAAPRHAAAGPASVNPRRDPALPARGGPSMAPVLRRRRLHGTAPGRVASDDVGRAEPPEFHHEQDRGHERLREADEDYDGSEIDAVCPYRRDGPDCAPSSLFPATHEGLVFNRSTGGVVSRSMLSKALARAMKGAKVARFGFTTCAIPTRAC